MYYLIMLILASFAIFGVIKSSKSDTVKALTAICIAALSIGLMAYEYSNESELNKGAKELKTAADAVRMYELKSSHELSNAPVQANQELIETCRRLQHPGLYYLTVDSSLTDRAGLDKDDFSRLIGTAAKDARLLILEHDTNNESLKFAYIGLVDCDHKRITKMLYPMNRHNEPVDNGVMKFGLVNGRKLINYKLAAYYYSNHQYGRALNKLKLTLGSEWAKSGKIDPWWQKNLPPRPEDHLWFGYLLYKAKCNDHALSEFRYAKGQSATIDDMRGTYKAAPKLPN